MPISLRNETAIAGIGQTGYSKCSDVSELVLACEAVSNCLDDAGLDPSEVDGLVSYTLDSSEEVDVARAVPVEPLRDRAPLQPERHRAARGPGRVDLTRGRQVPDALHPVLE